MANRGRMVRDSVMVTVESGEPIGNQQRSFEWYYDQWLPTTAPFSKTGSQMTPHDMSNGHISATGDPIHFKGSITNNASIQPSRVSVESFVQCHEPYEQNSQ